MGSEPRSVSWKCPPALPPQGSLRGGTSWRLLFPLLGHIRDASVHEHTNTLVHPCAASHILILPLTCSHLLAHSTSRSISH